MIVGLRGGGEALIRPMFVADTTPAELRAMKERLPILLPADADLVGALGGDPTIVDLFGGGQALLRLYSADELMEVCAEAGAALEADGLPPGPGMTHEQAVRLTTPVRAG